MTCALVLSCILTALGADAPVESPAIIIRSYDLRSIVPSLGGSPSLPLLPYEPSGVPESAAAPEEVDRPDPSMVADAIMNLMGSEFEYENRGLHVIEDSRLVVAAPPEVQDKVQRALGAFQAAFSAGIEVLVDVVSLKPDADASRLAPSAVISTAEAERLLADLKGVTDRASSHRVRLQPGRSSVMDITRQISFLRDYDVEIAKSASIADPIVDTARVGTQLLLRGVPAADGVALSLFLRRADLLELRKREFPISAGIVSERGGLAFEECARDVQSPDIQFRSFVLNTFLHDGHALVASTSLEGQRARSQEIVVIRLAGERPSPVQTLRMETTGSNGVRVREMTLVDGALLAPPTISMSPLSRMTPTLAFGPFNAQEEGSFLNAAVKESRLDMASEMLQQVFPEQSFAAVRPLLVNVRDAGEDAPNLSIKPAVLELAPKQVARSITLVLKRGARVARICVPVRLGDVSGGLVGVEQNLISDYDVDVAEMAMIPNPICQTIVDGVGFWMRPTLAPSGDLSLELKVKANLRADDGRETEIRSPFYSKIDLPAFDTFWIDEQLRFEAGTKEITLGDAASSLQVRVD
jgi:hypothetical protein